MSGPETHERPALGASCAECGAPLAHDQRYCVRCGARRGPLPPAVAETLMALAAGARGSSRLAGARPARTGARDRSDPFAGAGAALAALSPRAAAVAVMAMLAFGVVVGSGASSLAANTEGPVILALSGQPQPTISGSTGAGAPVTAASVQNPGSATTPPTVTQTVAAQTVTSPSSSTGGGGGGGGSSGGSSGSTPSLPPVKHVFVVMLSNQGYNRSFGPDTVLPYLAHTLRKQGELFPYYYGVAQSPLANGVALISGQGPTPQTELNCPQFSDITPATSAAEGQVLGNGCVYPASTQTLPTQLVAAGDTWKAYVEGMNDGPAGTTKACRKPTLNGADPAQAPQAGDPYVTWRNPLVYFQSLNTTCARQDVGLQQLGADLKSANKTPTLSYIVPSPCDDGSETVCPTPIPPTGVTAADTTSTPTTPTTTTTTTPTTPTTTTTTTTTPTTSTPTTTASTTTTGTPSTPVTAPATVTAPTPAQIQASDQATESFLRSVIPRIEKSRAYKKNGLIAITFDEAPQTGPHADQTACCANPTYPNLPATSTSPSGTTTTSSSTSTPTATTTPTTSTGSPPTTTGSSSTTTSTSSTTTTPAVSNGNTTPSGGGGQVGLLLISPYIKHNTSNTIDYFNHYSLLASIEVLLSLQRIGYASVAQLPTLQPAAYNAYKGSS